MAISIPPYASTPLMNHIDSMIHSKKSPYAFAVANFGEGPVLTYRGNKCAVDFLMANFILGDQRIRFSHQSEPPYFVALAQQESLQSISVIIYGDGRNPLLSCDGDSKLTGQIIASNKDTGGRHQVVAHALLLPELSDVYASINRRESLQLEGDTALCEHLLLCGIAIESMLCRSLDAGKCST